MSPTIEIGPLLRHVDHESAAVWVQTDGPARVGVDAGGHSAWADTFSAHGAAAAGVR